MVLIGFFPYSHLYWFYLSFHLSHFSASVFTITNSFTIWSLVFSQDPICDKLEHFNATTLRFSEFFKLPTYFTALRFYTSLCTRPFLCFHSTPRAIPTCSTFSGAPLCSFHLKNIISTKFKKEQPPHKPLTLLL